MKINNPIRERQEEICKVSEGKININSFLTPVLNFRDIDFDVLMDKDSHKLLESAYKELHLTQEQLQFIENCTIAIIKLENIKIAQSHHVAEAIQYAVDYHQVEFLNGLCKQLTGGIK